PVARAGRLGGTGTAGRGTGAVRPLQLRVLVADRAYPRHGAVRPARHQYRRPAAGLDRRTDPRADPGGLPARGDVVPRGPAAPGGTRQARAHPRGRPGATGPLTVPPVGGTRPCARCATCRSRRTVPPPRSRRRRCAAPSTTAGYRAGG